MDLHVCLWMLKESNKSRFDSFGVRGSALIISHILPFVIVRCNFLATTFLEIVCINGISPALASSLIQYPYPVIQTAEFRVGHMFLCHWSKFKTQVIYFIYIFIFSFSNLTSVG